MIELVVTLMCRKRLIVYFLCSCELALGSYLKWNRDILLTVNLAHCTLLCGATAVGYTLYQASKIIYELRAFKFQLTIVLYQKTDFPKRNRSEDVTLKKCSFYDHFY